MNNIPLDILQLIAKFIVPKKYELCYPEIEPKLVKDFLNINPCQKIVDDIVKNPKNLYRMHFYVLSKNTSDTAVDFLLKNPLYIEWKYFSSNSSTKAVQLLLKNQVQIIWSKFSENTNDLAVQYLIENPTKIYWEAFSRNTNSLAVRYMLTSTHIINYKSFSGNTNQMAVDLLLSNTSNIYWEFFMKNSNDSAVDMILHYMTTRNTNTRNTHPNELWSSNLSLNNNTRVVDFLIQNPIHIYWPNFVKNTSPKAVEFMVRPENVFKINWNLLSANPSIFREIDDHEYRRRIKDTAYSLVV
jgi:hypothetical protein